MAETPDPKKPPIEQPPPQTGPMGKDADPNAGRVARHPRGRADKWIKLGFLVILLVAGVFIYMHQRGGPSLNWQTNWKYVVDKAGRDGRPVVLFFESDPPSQAGKDMIRDSLDSSPVRKYLAEWNFEKAHVRIAGDLKADDAARRYGVTQLPAIVTLDKTGAVRGKMQGRMIGHAPLVDLMKQARGEQN